MRRETKLACRTDRFRRLLTSPLSEDNRSKLKNLYLALTEMLWTVPPQKSQTENISFPFQTPPTKWPGIVGGASRAK